MKRMFSIEVNNVPADCEKYVVARLVNGKLWYWGSWTDENEAERAAERLENGTVVVF